MRYMFIDTNILITNAVPTGTGHLDIFIKLKKLLKQNEVNLIMPEVVKIEYEKNIEDIIEDDKKPFINILDVLEKKKFIYDKFPDYLHVKEVIEKTIRDLEKYYWHFKMETADLFDAKNKAIRYVSLSDTIFSKAYVRCIRGRKPFKKRHEKYLQHDGKNEPGIAFAWIRDALIVESLISEFNGKVANGDELLFCCENVKDFADNTRTELHEEIKADFPEGLNITYYSDLNDLFKRLDISLDDNDVKQIKSIKEADNLVRIRGKLPPFRIGNRDCQDHIEGDQKNSSTIENKDHEK